jgi:hypothetical protein
LRFLCRTIPDFIRLRLNRAGKRADLHTHEHGLQTPQR